MSSSEGEPAAWLRPLLEADLKHWRDREAAYLPNVEREGEWLWHQARGHADHAEAELAILDEAEKALRVARTYKGGDGVLALACAKTWLDAVRLLASGYKHWPGYQAEAWKP